MMDVDILKRRWLYQAILGAASITMSIAAPAATSQKILILGDSLSAEYGLARGTGWVALLEKKLAAEKIRSNVVNASISGDTTSGGLSRLPNLLAQHKPNIVIIELGGNDALRGFAAPQTEKNFLQLIELNHNAGAKTLLLGMQVPPNMGPVYAKEFAAIYPRVAKSKKIALVPFFLKDVADTPDSRQLFQSDGIHPLAIAHPTLLSNVWLVLKKLLK